MTITRIVSWLTLGVALATAAGACRKAAPETEPATPVAVAPAILGSIKQTVTADAVLYPRDQANITSKISAPVLRFLVNRGDRVKQGQLLAELENRDLIAAAVAGKGQYAQAESNYRSTAEMQVPESVTKAQSDLDAAREGLDAAKNLLESRQQLFKDGALARKQVDEAQVGYAQAKAQFDTAQQHLQAVQSVGKEEQVKSAAGQLEAARGQYDSAQAQVSYSEIRSPITGVITDRPLYPGEMAAAGAPMLTIMDTSAVVARINMTQDQTRDINVGAAATLAVDGEGEPLPGKVTVVSPAVDPNSTTMQVWVQVANPDGRLRVGASVHASIVVREIDGAVLIPAPAVLPSDEGGVKVMTVDEKNIAHEKKIEIGAKEGDLVQVTSGIEAGERVVTVGGLGLEDKAPVTILKPGEKRPGEEEKDDKEDEK